MAIGGGVGHDWFGGLHHDPAGGHQVQAVYVRVSQDGKLVQMLRKEMGLEGSVKEVARQVGIATTAKEVKLWKSLKKKR